MQMQLNLQLPPWKTQAGAALKTKFLMLKSGLLMESKDKQKKKKMKATSDKNHQPVEVGDNITIPDGDKAKSDLRNVMGVVLEKNDELHKIGTRHGIINRLCCRYVDFNISFYINFAESKLKTS